MATIEEGRFCQNDDDCSEIQYCYNVSGQCVNYTLCNRYNRKEGQRRARNPSQCGPCLTGYTSEVLGTGEMASLCKKINNYEKTESGKLSNTALIRMGAIIGVILCVLVTMIVAFFLKRRFTARREKNHPQWGDICVAEPSAPPAENMASFAGPFIGCSNREAHSPSNNNQNLKDKNKLLRAAPYKEPNWIRTNPNYEYNLSNDSLNVSDQSHSIAQLPTTENNTDNWPPEQFAIQVGNGNVAEYGIEQVDNTMNAVLVQRNIPSTSNNAEGNNNNNNADSTSGSNDAQDNRQRGRASNILISQKITMNVNMLNGD